MKEEVRYCEACGGKLVRYWHRLTRGLVRALLNFAEFGPGEHKLLHKGNTKGRLTYSQTCNFQKLQYFDLVEKRGEGPHSGLWAITELGWRFIAGAVRVPSSVCTFRADVVEVGDDYVGIRSVKHDPYFLKFDDYVAESEGVA